MSVSLASGTKELEEALSALRAVVKVKQYFIGGSVAIVGEGNDIDVVVLLDEPLEWAQVNTPSFTHCGEDSYNSAGMFDAYRYGNINFILVEDSEYYGGWMRATAVCQDVYVTYGYIERATRVTIHRRILGE